MYFPPAFFDVMVHLLVHIVDDIVHLGPPFLHNMMAFERMNGVIKGYVRNRARPDGSIAQGFLTKECINGVLDGAINGFVEKAGPIKKEVVMQGQLIFQHNTTFPCLKQPTNSSRDGYYAIHHMREFVRDQHQIMLLSNLQNWRKDFVNASDADVQLEIYRI
jgi:hypothetical protein